MSIFLFNSVDCLSFEVEERQLKNANEKYTNKYDVER